MFGFLNKKQSEVQDTDLIAPIQGQMIAIETVKDPVFAQKMMGDGVAFEFGEDKAEVVAPTNGTLSVLYPTGHAFGITNKAGVEILIHIGIDTVQANGDGFYAKKKQGDKVKAGETIVVVDVKKLKQTYDMTTMLVITNANGQSIQFMDPQSVEKGQIINV